MVFVCFQDGYNDTVNFTVPELKRCLVAFWKRHQLLNEDVDYRMMWSTRIPQDVHVDTSNWKSICDYWNEEVQQFLTDDRYTVNELLFDNFRKMLSEHGFQDDSDPFYLGYVSTKFSTKHQPKYHFIYCIIFKPSWSVVHNKQICYVARDSESFYVIEKNSSKD